MLRNTFFATMAVLGLAASSQAALIVSAAPGVALPNLPGYKSYTISVESTVATEQIQGVDFAGDGGNDPVTGKGFFGLMNQVGPPLISTTFMDNNGIIPALNPGKTSAEDSQFLITTTQANVAVPSGFAEEGANILQGIWAWTEPQGLKVNFAQLIIPDAAAGTVNFRGSFSLNTPGGIVDSATVSGVLPIPEPATFALVGLAAFGMVAVRRRK